VLARRFARALRAGERRRDGLLRKSRRRRGTISGRRGRSDGGRPGLLTSKRDPSSRKTLLWMTAKNRWMLGRWARRSGSSADPSARKTLPLDDGQKRFDAWTVGLGEAVRPRILRREKRFLWMTAKCGWPAWSIALNGFASVRKALNLFVNSLPSFPSKPSLNSNMEFPSVEHSTEYARGLICLRADFGVWGFGGDGRGAF
jgi:hypothetical protein